VSFPYSLLKTAACFGNFFEFAPLAKLLNQPLDQILEDLSETIQEGLMVQSGEEYRFSHDRIQEAAYSLISDSSKIKLHHQIGTYLLSLEKNAGKKQIKLHIINHLECTTRLMQRKRQIMAC